MMVSLFKNPEVRSMAVKVLLFQILLAALFFMFVQYNMAGVNREITNQNTAMLGRILYNHPELEGEIASYVTRGAAQQEIEKGREVLAGYGYTENMSIYSQPVLKSVFTMFGTGSAFFMLLAFIPLVLLIMMGYKKLYGKVNKISRAAENVVEGNFNFELDEGDEGEFAVLAHNFNSMADRLKMSLESLKDEKIFLRNIISDISHQLKTPLSSLVIFNELMLQDKDMDRALIQDFLVKTKSQLERMEWLIINLLKMARLESGAIVFDRKPTLVKGCIERALSSLKLKIEEKKQSINITGDVDTAISNMDEGWTGEALTNIIKNCVEHTDTGGIINVEVSETPLFTRIEISDNGEGIDKKDIPHIFERFYKGSSTVKTESVGIGLALTKLIVEGQDGDVSVSSKKGEGTRFTVTFLKGVV